MIDFTNVLTKMQIERLAEADQHELVNEVQASFYPYSSRRRRRRFKLIVVARVARNISAITRL